MRRRMERLRSASLGTPLDYKRARLECKVRWRHTKPRGAESATTCSVASDAHWRVSPGENVAQGRRAAAELGLVPLALQPWPAADTGLFLRQELVAFIEWRLSRRR